MLALLIALAAPDLHCPPDVGQLRWRAVAQQTGEYALTVSVWDANQDGKPSDGDLAHIDTAKRGAVDLRLDESWFRIGADFAGELTAALGKRPPVCEARPAVNTAPPRLKALKGLTRTLDAAYKPVIAREKRVAYLREQMRRWGTQICKDKRFRPHGEVAQLLVAKAKKFDDLDGNTVTDIAFETARHESITCTKVAENKVSF